jgi:hypothetical protein
MYNRSEHQCIQAGERTVTFSRWRKPVESLEGNGRVSVRGEIAAMVHYRLDVEIEDLMAKTFSGEPKALIRQTQVVSGTITLLEGTIDPPVADRVGASLTLLLEDGRELDFHLMSWEARDGDYLIQGDGELRVKDR